MSLVVSCISCFFVVVFIAVLCASASMFPQSWLFVVAGVLPVDWSPRPSAGPSTVGAVASAALLAAASSASAALLAMESPAVAPAAVPSPVIVASPPCDMLPPPPREKKSSAPVTPAADEPTAAPVEFASGGGGRLLRRPLAAASGVAAGAGTAAVAPAPASVSGGPPADGDGQGLAPESKFYLDYSLCVLILIKSVRSGRRRRRAWVPGPRVSVEPGVFDPRATCYHVFPSIVGAVGVVPGVVPPALPALPPSLLWSGPGVPSPWPVVPRFPRPDCVGSPPSESGALFVGPGLTGLAKSTLYPDFRPNSWDRAGGVGREPVCLWPDVVPFVPAGFADVISPEALAANRDRYLRPLNLFPFDEPRGWSDDPFPGPSRVPAALDPDPSDPSAP